MNTSGLVRAFLGGRLSLGELHSQLHEADERGLADPYAAAARRLIAEATSAGWGKAALKREFGRFVSRIELSKLGALAEDVPVDATRRVTEVRWTFLHEGKNRDASSGDVKELVTPV